MFKIEIKNLQNVVTNRAEFLTNQLCLDWLNSVKLTGAFGKLNRQVKEITLGVLDNNEDISKSTTVTITPADGNRPEIRMHTLPQEFTHTITDTTIQKLAENESYDAKQYLASTDWYVIRKSEDGVLIPSSITLARAAARLKVL